MNKLPEFAEEYSKAERIRFITLGLIAGAVLISASKLWLFPWIGAFAASAPCRTVFGLAGTTVLWYSLFAGLPLQGAVLVACTFGPRGYQILRDAQVPPLREKVFRPTRIKRGAQARLVGYLHVLAFAPFLALTVWGCVEAAALSKQGKLQPATCTTDPAIERTATSTQASVPP